MKTMSWWNVLPWFFCQVTDSTNCSKMNSLVGSLQLFLCNPWGVNELMHDWFNTFSLKKWKWAPLLVLKLEGSFNGGQIPCLNICKPTSRDVMNSTFCVFHNWFDSQTWAEWMIWSNRMSLERVFSHLSWWMHTCRFLFGVWSRMVSIHG